MDVFDEDENEDSRDLIDLRFFGSLSDDDLMRWNRDDNDNCLRCYDPEWCPGDMACSRAPVYSSHHGSGLGGNNMMIMAAQLPDYDVIGNEEAHATAQLNNKNNRKSPHHQRQRSGGGHQYYHNNYGGEVDPFGGMSERPGFTFVRPSAAMLNGQHVY